MRDGNFSFSWVFRLKITIGFNFVPSTRQERMTVKQDFLWPVVLIMTNFSPYLVTVLGNGMSNHMSNVHKFIIAFLPAIEYEAMEVNNLLF